MASQLGVRLRNRLDKSEVILELQRRGRDPKPGRPDSVIWLRPKDLPVRQLIPLLVELEGAGNYHASKADVKQFAARHSPQNRPANDDFQYHLDIPILDWEFTRSLDEPGLPDKETSASMTIPVNYDVFAIPAASVTGEQHTTDAKLHRALREIFGDAWRQRTTPPGISTDAHIRNIRGTEIVYWNVHWSLPNAHQGTVSYPFIVTTGPDIETVLRSEINPITLPMMAVINGSPSAREETCTYETGIYFQGITLSQQCNTDNNRGKELGGMSGVDPQVDLESGPHSTILDPAQGGIYGR